MNFAYRRQTIHMQIVNQKVFKIKIENIILNWRCLNPSKQKEEEAKFY